MSGCGDQDARAGGPTAAPGQADEVEVGDHPPSFLVVCSSVWPIDLSGALFACLREPPGRVEVIIDDEAELPDDPLHRQGTARAALPTALWSCDRGGIWRQRFIPLEGEVTPHEAVALAARTYADLVRAGGLESRADAILERADALAEALTTAMPRSWIEATQVVISAIFAQVAGTVVRTAVYSEARETSTWRAAGWRLMAQIHSAAARSGTLRGRRGAYVELRERGSENSWRRYTAFGAAGRSLSLSGDCVSNLTLPVDFTAGRPASEPNYQLRFGGPLEVAHVAEAGRLAHLPWYCHGKYASPDRPAGGRHREFISPIAVTDPYRSVGVSDGGSRLRPTGYSLAEYESPITDALTYALLGPEVESYRDELLDLISQFPAVGQKLQKSQGRARGYRATQERALLDRLKRGDTDIVAVAVGRAEGATVGSRLVALIAIISLARSWSVAKSDLRPSRSMQAALASHGLYADGRLLIPPLVSNVGVAATAVREWLVARGAVHGIIDAQTEALVPGIRDLSEVGELRIIPPLISYPTGSSGIGFVVKGLRGLAGLYYEFLAFVAGSVLKASVFPTYLLFGDDYAEQARQILRRRQGAEYLEFEPQWQ